MGERKQSDCTWSLSRACSRAVSVLREEGGKSLWFKVLGETVYRRVVLFERPLTEPLAEVPPGIPITVERLTENAISDYIRFQPEADPADICRRLATGQVCFVARHQGEIVHASWSMTKQARIDYLGYEVALAPDEVYAYETYTAPSFRGQNIPLSRSVQEGHYFRAAGYQRMVAVVMPENTSGLQQTKKAGYHSVGTMGSLKLGPWRYDFCRVKPGVRPLVVSHPESSPVQIRQTMARIGRRTVEVLRNEGMKSLWFKILGETIYRRAILVEHVLDKPEARVTSSLPAVISLLSEDEVDSYLSFRPEADSANIRSRLRAGHLCFVARHEGRIVSAAWIATGSVWLDYLTCQIKLAVDEAYLYESFTLSEFRGQNIPAVRAAHEAQYFRDAGCQRIIAIIMPENKPALRHAEKAGWKPFGLMGYLKLGPWRQDFCRVKPGARPPGERLDSHGPAYWDKVGQPLTGESHYLDGFLGALKRQAYLNLIQRWGGLPTGGRALKTDLFEEALGPDAFLTDLNTGDACVIGMDVSPERTRQAQKQGDEKPIHCITADARALPFTDSSFAFIISPSTLDHFPDPHDLGRSLQELARVLVPEGRLIITLDNRQNIFDPLLRLAHRLGWVPYYLGRSYRVGELRQELEAAGFVVEETTAILHNPRLVAVAAVTLAKKLKWRPLTSWVQRTLVAAQRLEHTRWCYFTGSFVAAKAVRK